MEPPIAGSSPPRSLRLCGAVVLLLLFFLSQAHDALAAEPALDESIDEEWESYFLPGASFTVHSPRDASLGVLHGVSLEIVAGAWIHRNENRGPSHGRVYFLTELLQSTQPEAPLTLGYGLGFTLSLERNPERRWLIPFYGLDLGGIRQDVLGSRFQTTPHAGVHLWASQNIFLNARAGYRIVPGNLEQWGGWFASVGGDFTVW